MGCGASVSTASANHNGTQPNGNLKNNKIPVTVTKASLKGDYSQFQLAKYQREKQQKERQQRLFIAADELSGKVLEERERLSLGTRSRATSRNTSRTTSPTTNKRNAQNREEHTVPMTPVIEDRNRSESYRSENSLNRHSMGATITSESQENKKKIKHKTKRTPHKGDKTKSKSKKKSHKKTKTKRKISVESYEHDSGLEDSPHNNDSSDGVQSVDHVNKQEDIDDDAENKNACNSDIKKETQREGSVSYDRESERRELVERDLEDRNIETTLVKRGLEETNKVTNDTLAFDDTHNNQTNQIEGDKALNDNGEDSERVENSKNDEEVTGDNQVVTGGVIETEESTIKKVRFEESETKEDMVVS